jgi:hypothetical protein
MGTAGLHGTYAAVVAVLAVAIVSALASGVAYIVVFSVIYGYGARDSSYGPMDKSGTQHEWTAEERERFRRRRRLSLIVAACVGLALFGAALWLASRAVL